MTPELACYLTEEAMLAWHETVMKLSGSKSLEYHSELNDKFRIVSQETELLKTRFREHFSFFLSSLEGFTKFIPFNASPEVSALFKTVLTYQTLEDESGPVTLEKIVRAMRKIFTLRVISVKDGPDALSISTMSEILVRLLDALKSPTNSTIASFLCYLIRWSELMRCRKAVFSKLKAVTDP